MMDREFIEKLLILYSEYNKVYGPYKRKDNRKHLILCKSGYPKNHPDKLKTISYPKALVEVNENRCLEDYETVDHINEDFTDDDLDNLQILSRKNNVIKSLEKNNKLNGKYYECDLCKKLVYRCLSEKKENVFCSQKCRANYKWSNQYSSGRIAQ